MSIVGGFFAPRKEPHNLELDEDVTGLEGTLECRGGAGDLRMSSQGLVVFSSEQLRGGQS